MKTLTSFINEHIFEALRIKSGTKFTSKYKISINELLTIMGQILNLDFEKSDKLFIDALKDFCNDCVTDISNIEIHTDFKGMSVDYMGKIEKDKNDINVIKKGSSSYDTILIKFYDDKKNIESIKFNEDRNPLEENLDINKKLKMFCYDSIEGGLIFIA
jgi:hypothetical protein